MFTKRFLQDVHVVGAAQTFDGRNVCAVGLGHEHGASFDRLTVDGHSASATVGCFAANVWARDIETFAQRVDQQFARFGQKFMALAVHVEFDVHLV